MDLSTARHMFNTFWPKPLEIVCFHSQQASEKMKITIRLAKPSDASSMADIHASSWEVAYRDIMPMGFIKEKNATRADMWKRIVTDDNTTHYVIEADGSVAGIMTIAPPDDEDAENGLFEIHGIYLHPDFFRKGIGTQAVNFVLDKARKQGNETVILWVLAENTNAIKFYKKCGFSADGETKTKDVGRNAELIRMCRNLVQ